MIGGNSQLTAQISIVDICWSNSIVRNSIFLNTKFNLVQVKNFQSPILNCSMNQTAPAEASPKKVLYFKMVKNQFWFKTALSQPF